MLRRKAGAGLGEGRNALYLPRDALREGVTTTIATFVSCNAMFDRGESEGQGLVK